MFSPEAFLAVLAAEPDVSIGDCAVASMLPRIASQTNNIRRLYTNNINRLINK
jgi:hypothetical protein